MVDALNSSMEWLRCPKCGAEMEYCVTGDTVTVRVLRLSEK